MKRKFADIFTATLLAVWALALLLLPKLTSSAVTAGLKLCAEILIPSLFPFFVCSNLLCALGLTAKLSKPAKQIMQPLFRVGGGGVGALIMGFIGGYPTGAQNIASLYASGQISKAEASQLLKFCCACGPAFLIGVVGSHMFGSTQTGILLYLIHAICAIITGVLLRPKIPTIASNTQETQASPPTFSAAFTQSVKKAGASSLQVCMFVVTFRVLLELLLFFLPDKLDLFAAGVLELSSGITRIKEIPIPQTTALTLISFFAGFGGIGVYAQTAALLSDVQLPVKGYLSAKLLHAILCAVGTFVMFSLFPTLAGTAQASTFPIFSSFKPILISIWLFCGGLCLLFHKLASRNLQKHRV